MGRPAKNQQVPTEETQAPVTTEIVIDTNEVQTEGTTGLPSNIHVVNVSMEGKEKVFVNDNDVLFEYNYPKDYEGKKWFKDGHKSIISKESAIAFTKLSIGKVIEKKK
jgi:hypothetical protein